MPIYGAAITSGISALSLAFTGESAETTAAFNVAYATAARKASIIETRHAAQLSIAAIQQDKITSNIKIRMNQDQTEAWAKVNAAVAGVSGGSIDDVVEQTEADAVYAQAAAERQAEQRIDTLGSQIVSQTSSLGAVQEPIVDNGLGSFLQGISTLSLDDVESLGEHF